MIGKRKNIVLFSSAIVLALAICNSALGSLVAAVYPKSARQLKPDTITKTALIDTLLADSLRSKLSVARGDSLLKQWMETPDDPEDTLFFSWGDGQEDSLGWQEWNPEQIQIPSSEDTSTNDGIVDSLLYGSRAQMSKRELRRYLKDSVWAVRDSIIRATPRILFSKPFPDSIMYKRMFLWRNNTWFNTMEVTRADTTFNDYFHDLPYLKNDVGATYLGVSGSPMQYYNYFNRSDTQLFPFFDVYKPYTFTPDDIVHYNTKTPYTELGYWGTLFANREQEEANLRILHTQNLSPAFNFQVMYKRNGGKGILKRESTDHRSFSFTANYLGKRYTAHAGYIFSRVKKNENGGVEDRMWIEDTILDARTIPVKLQNASSEYYRTVVWLSHSLRIPFRFLNRSAQKADTAALALDSLPAQAGNTGRNKFAAFKDNMESWDGTSAYIGHYFEYTKYARKYIDERIDTDIQKQLYHNKFYIDPTQTADSINSVNVENRLYLRMQPWKKTSVVSNLDAGIGLQLLKFYTFNPRFFLEGNDRRNESNTFVYFGANGTVKKYFAWNGFAKYVVSGYNSGDLAINGAMRFSAYPNKGGIHFLAKVDFRNERPSYFYNNYYSNHHIWNNSFSNVTTTKLEGRISIPDYDFEASVGYALLKNNIYLDSLAEARQNTEAMSVFSVYARKDFKLGILRLENRLLFQLSSKDEIVPLPKLALNLRYYLQFVAVKNVLQMQIGADMTYNTKFYKQAYAPELGLFYNQRSQEYGKQPYIDAFINMQWKRASIFVKVENVLQDMTTKDYFSADYYIRPQRSIRFGIFWPFYIKHNKQLW